MSLTIEWHDELEPLRDDWALLAERSGNVFATWEWCATWWRHFGRGRPAVASCRQDGTPVAVVPFYVLRRGPLGVARFIGHGPADEQGAVSADGDPRGMGALAAASAEVPGGPDVLFLERLRADGWSGPPGTRVLRREPSPVASIHGLTWDEYLAGRSANVRSQVRRKERKLQREHGLTYRLTTDRSTLERDLETLFRLHAARWGAASSGGFAGARADFHRDFAAAALERGWLRLWTAEAGGRPVASWYGLRFDGAESYYQSGRDPAWDRASVGLVLLAHTIREAIADGMAEYRFLRGGESYKDRFATGDPGLKTIAAGRGAAGRAAVTAAALALRLPSPIRRRVVQAVG